MQSMGGRVHLGYLLLLRQACIVLRLWETSSCWVGLCVCHNPHHLPLASLQSSSLLCILSRFYSCTYQETNYLLDCSCSVAFLWLENKEESKKITRWFINKPEKKIHFRIIARIQAGASWEHLFATPHLAPKSHCTRSKIKLKKKFFFTSIYICVTACLQRSEDNSQGAGSLLLLCGFCGSNSGSRLGSKFLYMLSHFVSPMTTPFKTGFLSVTALAVLLRLPLPPEVKVERSSLKLTWVI